MAPDFNELFLHVFLVPSWTPPFLYFPVVHAIEYITCFPPLYPLLCGSLRFSQKKNLLFLEVSPRTVVPRRPLLSLSCVGIFFFRLRLLFIYFFSLPDPGTGLPCFALKTFQSALPVFCRLALHTGRLTSTWPFFLTDHSPFQGPSGMSFG